MIRGKDIARRVGVSKETVSAVLSGRWEERRICLRTRDRVLAAAQRMGYVPLHAARRLVRLRSGNHATNFDQVGMIYLMDMENDLDTVCLAMMRGAEHELARLRASLTFLRVSEHGDWEKVERMTRSGDVDGWLVYGAVDDGAMTRLKSAPLNTVPSVVLGDHQCRQPVHSVNFDNAAVGRQAAQHLASLGHRRILYFGTGTAYIYQQQTLSGFRAAVKELGLDDDGRLIGNISLWNNSDRETAGKWLQRGGLAPTALFAPEWDSMVDAWHLLKQWRLEVPGDLSLIGCEQASKTARDRNLTRLEMPISEAGSQGVSMLRELASMPRDCVRPMTVKIPARLVEGWSCRSVAPSNPCHQGKPNAQKRGNS